MKSSFSREQADFIVSPGGMSLVEARNAVRARREAGEHRRFRIYAEKGEYRGSLRLDKSDGDTDWTSDGAVLSGGLSLNSCDFTPLTDDEKSRLHGDAAKRVRRIDLKKYGLTKADWGEICPIGAFSTARKYDGVATVRSCEVFYNGIRMTEARYPNEGFLRIDSVLDVGDVREFPEQNYFLDWDGRRNHRGGAYITDKQTAYRAAGWREPEKAWMYGFFYHDWADSSTPIASLDAAHRTVRPAYVTPYGCRRGGRYFFYNVFEELDAPGEFYLDRDSGMLYIYPRGELGSASVEISIAAEPVVSIEADGVKLSGFSIRCARADGATVLGDGNEISDCLICSVAGNGVTAKGTGNAVRRCEITHTGEGGIVLTGGDRETLTAGASAAEDNQIHDYAEIVMFYRPAVSLYGAGNICAHNEIYNAPHMAVYYSGNDHLIEYNRIYNVVRLSSDAGAIYGGMDWAAYGTVIRYNYLRDIGEGENRPNGIYWDDALSGQTAYGNTIVNAGQFGFLIGGGRDNSVTDNVIAGCGSAGIEYDDRARDAVVADGWAKSDYADPNGRGWQSLRAVPYRGEIWSKRFPKMLSLKESFADHDDPGFPPNPSGSNVSGNRIISKEKKFFQIAPSVYRYSDIGENELLTEGEALPPENVGRRG